MKKRTLSGFFFIAVWASLVMAGTVLAGDRTISPLVSTKWLAANSGSSNLLILDVRSAGEYKAGHIPGSISAPFGLPVSAWTAVRNKLFLEVPETPKLLKTIGSLGIKPDSRVVVVCSQSNPKVPIPPHYGLANGTRVAFTLIYAGVPNVAILDGGFPKWQAEKRQISKQASKPKPVVYKGAVKTGMLVSMAYVRSHLKSANLIDGRDAIVYYGATVTRWANKPGHIPGASSLPATWLWKSNKGGYYTFRDRKTLAGMASGVSGKGETIVYCGVGGYASSLWYVLSQVLGKKNVKIYDGAAEQWSRHNNMTSFRWQ